MYMVRSLALRVKVKKSTMSRVEEHSIDLVTFTISTRLTEFHIKQDFCNCCKYLVDSLLLLSNKKFSSLSRHALIPTSIKFTTGTYPSHSPKLRGNSILCYKRHQFSSTLSFYFVL